MQDTSYEQLAIRAKNDDDDAFNELLKAFEKTFSKFKNTYFIVGCDKDDVMQYCLIGLFKAVMKFNGKEGFYNFAVVCIKNNILSEVRKRNGNLAIDKDTDNNVDDIQSLSSDPLEVTVNKTLSNKILQVIESECTEKEKKVFFKYLEGYDYTEIARALNTSKKSVDNAIQRVRKKVKSKVEV